MLDLDLLLKRNELCLVGRDRMHESLHEAGLYVRDTRFLSAFSLAFKHEPLQFLDIQTPAADLAVITSTNPHLKHLELGIDPQTILVRLQISLDTALVVTVTVRNFGTVDVTGALDIDLGADFRDMFDIRGMTPKKRATPLAPTPCDGGVTLAARATDGAVVSTDITSSEPAEIVEHRVEDASAVTLRYPLNLRRDATETIELRIAPRPVGAPLESPSAVDITSPFAPHLAIESPSDVFDAFVTQSDADLALLQTSFPDGNIPAAGIPWFIAPFGRDSLIVGLQTMHAYPRRIASTLRVLARLQGTEVNAWREEQPGKILHEMRYGDMARTGQIPHTPYYGSIDSTPLFVMVFAQHYLWHADDALYDDLLDNVRRALTWIEEWGDLDDDGFIEYRGSQEDVAHIAQQGWKDSGDSLHFADGRDVAGPIALVEVQGYVFAAYRWLSDAVRLRGDDAAWADELGAKAERMREAVEAAFWMQAEGFYAQALDGEKRRVDAISSNPGHLLFCQLPSQERAALVARRLAAGDLHAGWGIRTLSSEMATYNPMSYHNGSIWPHDTSLAMAGLRAYGHNDFALQLGIDLLLLAADSPMYRLAELYCGFPQMEVSPGTVSYPVGPVDYPVSCSPQAWAAGAGLLVLRTLLGLGPDPETRGFQVDPHLPDGWDRVVVSGLKSGGELTNVTVERSGGEYAVTIDHDATPLASALTTPSSVV